MGNNFLFQSDLTQNDRSKFVRNNIEEKLNFINESLNF